MDKKALLITPTYFPALTGNAVTVHRIAKQLGERGIRCQILSVQEKDEDEGIRQALEFKPQIIHNFHAFKAGYLGLKIKERLPQIPMITTFTGTDLNLDLGDQVKKQLIGQVLASSEAITVFNEQARDLLPFPRLDRRRVKVIHQSVYLPEQSSRDYRSLLKIGHHKKVFLLLGAIRKVKAFGLALEVLAEMRVSYRDIHLIMAGQVLEPEEYDRIEKLMSGRNWVSYLGKVPREYIQSLYRDGDVVLSTSYSESESNVIMEALSFGRLVIARDIPGNASLIVDGQTGFSFRDLSELKGRIAYVLENYHLLEGVRTRAREHILKSFSYEREREAYVNLYGELMAGGSKPDVREVGS